jgi:hypothetical protein
MIKTARLLSLVVPALVVAGIAVAQPAGADPSQAPPADQRSARGLQQQVYKKVPGISVANKATPQAAAAFVTEPATASNHNASQVIVAQTVSESATPFSGELIFKLWSPSNGWQDWKTLGKPAAGLATSPSVTWANFNRVDLFATGVDKHLYQITLDISQPNPNPTWTDLGGDLLSVAPSASWLAGSRIDVFVVGLDFRLFQKTWTNGAGWSGWSGFAEPPALTGSGPSITWLDNGRLDVLVRGENDGATYQLSWAGGWSGWSSLGGTTEFGPSASWTERGRLDVFVTGTDNRPYQKTWAGAWSGWGAFTAPATGSAGGPSIDWIPNGTRLDVVTLGEMAEGGVAVFHMTWTSSAGWSTWENLDAAA